MEAHEVIELLELKPLEGEGGYFRQTHKSCLESDSLLNKSFAGAGGGLRAASTAIYYLITPDSFSSLHRLPIDEIFHFYLGEPVQQIQVSPQGLVQTFVIGNDLRSGQRPQVLVPKDCWQGSKLLSKTGFALLGTTMAPGFEFQDLELPGPGFLSSISPADQKLVASYLRDRKS